MNDEAETSPKLFKNKLQIPINSSRGKTELFFYYLYRDYYKISLHRKRKSKSMQSKKLVKILQRCVRKLINKSNCFFLNFMFVVFVAF